MNSVDWDLVARTWNFHRYNALQRKWAKDGPPVHRSVARYLGLGEDPAKRSSGDDFEADMRALAPSGTG